MGWGLQFGCVGREEVGYVHSAMVEDRDLVGSEKGKRFVALNERPCFFPLDFIGDGHSKIRMSGIHASPNLIWHSPIPEDESTP